MEFDFLQKCLFFTSNRLSRAITRMAEDEFADTGLTPMYGYLIRIVNGEPGITQKKLAEMLYVAPSTLTRFIDKLEGKKLVSRQVQGKTVLVFPTDKSLELEPRIRQASKNLESRYIEILGLEAARRLSQDITSSSEQLER